MRQFVLLAHDAPTEPDFSLDDLPGAGRLDLLARCITSAFLLSHELREDVRLWLVIRDRLTIRFEGAHLQGLNPDERSTAALVGAALERADEAVGHEPVESTPGVYVSRRTLEGTLRDCSGEGTLVRLHEEGPPVVELEPPADPVFVLSDHRSLTADEESLLADLAHESVRLGSRRLHADQAITVAHNYLDTAGYRRF